MSRLFVGIALNDAVRDFAAEVCGRLTDAGLIAGFQPREKLHATVAFIGSVAPERYEAVTEAVSAAAAACRQFTIRFDSLGGFPKAAKARVLWIGCASPHALYLKCAAAVRQNLEALGFSFSDEAVAHVTLARFKTPLRGLPEIQLPAAVTQNVHELTLFESTPAGGTTRYAICNTFALRS
jgi:2'-5' RNA ligase